jgi:hypothetical protein
VSSELSVVINSKAQVFLGELLFLGGSILFPTTPVFLEG